ncbi:hypothetical protein BDQ17DRAFT_1547350 [Cyathus striatus]|nr:hypothetical protein BDQ17DRAFT_1547350 [Cyathus striatus]
MAEHSQRLHESSISLLTITNLVVNSQGETIPVSLERCRPEEEDGKLECVILDPKPGATTFELEVSVKDDIGYGRCGIVLGTKLEALWDLSDPDPDEIVSPGPEYLPPLVLKVAGESNMDHLGKEALNYGWLRSLQGVAVPRYYGWFNLSLQEGQSISRLQASDEDSNNRVLSILVLERVGDHITLKESEDDIEDIRDVFRDISLKYVVHRDIRAQNICQAPKSPPGYAGEYCSFHERIHDYRIIDFDASTLSKEHTRPVISSHHIVEIGTLYR